VPPTNNSSVGPYLWDISESALFGSPAFLASLWGLIFMAASTSSPQGHKWQTQNPWSTWCLDLSLPHSLWESPLLRMAPQTLISCFKALQSDQELPRLRGLFRKLWLRHAGVGRDFNTAERGKLTCIFSVVFFFFLKSKKWGTIGFF
jgi:hypothetical protein